MKKLSDNSFCYLFSHSGIILYMEYNKKENTKRKKETL